MSDADDALALKIADEQYSELVKGHLETGWDAWHVDFARRLRAEWEREIKKRVCNQCGAFLLNREGTAKERHDADARPAAAQPDAVSAPKEPTMAMMVAGTDARMAYVCSPGSGLISEPYEESAECYRAMLAAAPRQPEAK